MFCCSFITTTDPRFLCVIQILNYIIHGKSALFPRPGGAPMMTTPHDLRQAGPAASSLKCALNMALVPLLATFLVACKIVVTVPKGGKVVTEDGFVCQAGEVCVIEVSDDTFDSTFTAMADEGYTFTRWARKPSALCGNQTGSCHLSTLLFSGFPVAFTLGGIGLGFGVIGLLLDDWAFSWAQFGTIPSRIFGGIAENLILTAIPMFIFMGTMLEKSGVARDLLNCLLHLLPRRNSSPMPLRCLNDLL